MKVKCQFDEGNFSVSSYLPFSDPVNQQPVYGCQLIDNIHGRWYRMVTASDADYKTRPDKTKDERPYDYDQNEQLEKFY